MGQVFVVFQLPYVISHKVYRGKSVSSTTSKMGLFATTVNGWKTLTIVRINSSIVFMNERSNFHRTLVSTVVSTTYYWIIRILL